MGKDIIISSKPSPIREDINQKKIDLSPELDQDLIDTYNKLDDSDNRIELLLLQILRVLKNMNDRA